MAITKEGYNQRGEKIIVDKGNQAPTEPPFTIGKMVDELKKAIDLDKEAGKTASGSPTAVKSSFFLREWISKYKIALIIAGVLLWIIFKGSKPAPISRKRSHHGINKYGDRY